MSYELLSPRQKQALDLLFWGKCCTQPFQNRYVTMGKAMGVTAGSAKQFIMQAAEKYGVEYLEWCVANRLVYLRAKELGML